MQQVQPKYTRDHYSSLPEYNRYCTLNPSELAESDLKLASRYEKAAIAAMVIGGILLVGVIIAAAVPLGIFLTPAGAVAFSAIAFIVGMQIYNSLVKNRIFAHFKEQEQGALARAEVNQGYAREIQRVKNYYSSQGRWTDYDYNIAGMHLYWKKRHRKVSEKITELNHQILTLDTQISDPSTPRENKTQLINNRTLLREQKHALREGELLDSKIYAAYFLHLGGNKTDTREAHEFLRFEPISLQELDDHREANKIRIEMNQQKVKKAPRYSSIDGKITLSRKEVREKDICTLSQEIFTRQKAA
ncbi:MAG: hypothetical protein KDK76_05050 [Chlamydiia bacterium]|nr:hypothetical protein [Chlamydiia bacterium]